VRSVTVKGLALSVGAFLVAAAMAMPANAATLRRGSTGGTGAITQAGGPGEVLWTWYETTETLSGNPASGSVGHAGNGDNILKLINPNGSANTNLAGGGSELTCAMIYVFDDDEELGECCGCPVTSAGIETFSVLNNLTSNWSPTGSEGQDNASGAIAIVASAPNNFSTASPSNGKFCPFGASGACNFGCDPTNIPGYSAPSTQRNLLGSIIHNEQVTTGTSTSSTISGLTEVALFDDAGGDAANLTYLQNACGALVGGSSGGAICSCPPE